MYPQEPLSTNTTVQNEAPFISTPPKKRWFQKKRTVVSLIVGLVIIGLVAAVTTALTSKAQAYTVPTTIAKDCSRDVTQLLTSWIKSLPDGTAAAPTVVDLGSGTCYGLNAPVGAGSDPTRPQTSPLLGAWSGLVLSDRHHLRITGDANKMPELRALGDAPRHPNTVSSNGINRAQLWIDEGDNIAIENIKVSGNNIAGGYNPSKRQEYDHNIRLIGTSNIKINNIVAQKSNGDGVAIAAKGPWTAHGKGAKESNKISIKNSRFDGNGRQAITVQSGDGVVIEGNNFNNQYYWPVDLEQHLELHSIKNVTISRNTITGTTPYGFVNIATQNLLPSTASGQNAGTSNITIDQNKFTAASSSCQEFVSINGGQTGNFNEAPTTNVRVTNNVMGINQYAVKINNAKNTTVTGNQGTTRTATRGCSASDSSNTATKLFGMVAAGNGVDTLTIQNNSFQRSAGDSNAVNTSDFVQVWFKGAPTGPTKNLTNCSNSTTTSATLTTYDQPKRCSGAPQLPAAPSITAPTENQSITIEKDNTTAKVSIVGTSTPGASLKLTVNAIEQTVKATENGNWKVQFTLPAGSYSVTGSETDRSGKVSATVTRQFKVLPPPSDTGTPPVVPPTTTPSGGLSIDGPLEGAGLATPNQSTRMLVTISGKATPGNAILVAIGNRTQRVTVPRSGEWSTRWTLSIGAYSTQVTEQSGATSVNVLTRKFSVVQ